MKVKKSRPDIVKFLKYLEPEESLEFLNGLQEDETFIYYDGPLLFTVKDRKLLALSIEQKDRSNFYLVSTYGDEALKLAIGGEISLRDLILSGWLWIVKWTFGFTSPSEAWAVDHSDLPEDFLPDSDCMLSIWVDPSSEIS